MEEDKKIVKIFMVLIVLSIIVALVLIVMIWKTNSFSNTSWNLSDHAQNGKKDCRMEAGWIRWA